MCVARRTVVSFRWLGGRVVLAKEYIYIYIIDYKNGTPMINSIGRLSLGQVAKPVHDRPGSEINGPM
jgi:hypothetical protein